MSTTSQKRANRANSTYSTGPSTEAGKATCSQNGLKHGLASSQLIIGDESEEEFDTLLAALIAEHKPTTITETLLVQDMAKYHWLADRALRLQNDALSPYRLSSDPIPAGLAVLIRYHTANRRAFERSFSTLLSLRKETEKSTIGSASQQASKPSTQPAENTRAAVATAPIPFETAENQTAEHPPTASAAT